MKAVHLSEDAILAILIANRDGHLPLAADTLDRLNGVLGRSKQSGVVGDDKKWFRNHYECACGTKWTDEWSCKCDDECPSCKTDVSPHQSDDLSPKSDD
ncbi:MAG: hypothetical protein HQL38_01575 [Alphaproteobacteria bacterium]|nr:hypothetical protein [Alphaproteobacteria bacterium]